MSTLRVGNRVEYLTYLEGEARWTPIGKVVGFGTSNGEPIAVVALTKPEWVESRTYFVTTLVVHLGSLRVERTHACMCDRPAPDDTYQCQRCSGAVHAEPMDAIDPA